MQRYHVRVRHDRGVITLHTAATSEAAAREIIQAAENCPASAILEVYPVSTPARNAPKRRKA